MLDRSTTVSAVLLPIVLIGSWMLFQWANAPQLLPSRPDQPDAFSTNVIAIQMTMEGKPKDQLITPLMVHYKANDSTDITTPHLVLFSETGTSWNLYANNGKTLAGIKIIELWNNVRIERAAGAQNQPLKMQTQTFKVYPDKEYAETKSPVTIQQFGSNVHSVGMHVNLKTETIDLLSKARGRYENTQSQNSSK